MTQDPKPLSTPQDRDAAPDELLEDGQEEVFSRTAVEHGLVKDPRALGPDDDEEPAGST